MPEDDGNPYDHDVPPYDGPEDECHCCIWQEGDEHGQLHPSPQTIKKIETRLAEKMKGAITHAIREKRAVTPIPISYDELMEIIDNTLKEKEGED